MPKKQDFTEFLLSCRHCHALFPLMGPDARANDHGKERHGTERDGNACRTSKNGYGWIASFPTINDRRSIGFYLAISNEISYWEFAKETVEQFGDCGTVIIEFICWDDHLNEPEAWFYCFSGRRMRKDEKSDWKRGMRKGFELERVSACRITTHGPRDRADPNKSELLSSRTSNTKSESRRGQEKERNGDGRRARSRDRARGYGKRSIFT